MNTPHISFVIPAYNAATMLSESIASIFAGNFEDGDEVIIVNDASSDDTGAVAEQLARTFPHVQVIHNEHNKGAPASRNVGIAQSTGNLIFNLDADNILVPGSVRTLKEALLSNGAHIAAFGEYHYFIGDTSRITHKWICKPGVCTLADFFAGHRNPGPGGNFLYTKQSWRDVGTYWEYGKGLHEAWGFTLKQLMAGHTLYVVPDTHYFHRHGHESLFVSESRDKPAEHALTKKMITSYKDRIDAHDWKYIITHPDWYERLDTRPIKIAGCEYGTNGVLTKTWYGRYWSLMRRLVRILKKFAT